MSKRIEIEEVENGYTVVCWKQEDGEMYAEPEKYVASDKTEVVKLIEEHLK